MGHCRPSLADLWPLRREPYRAVPTVTIEDPVLFTGPGTRASSAAPHPPSTELPGPAQRGGKPGLAVSSPSRQ